MAVATLAVVGALFVIAPAAAEAAEVEVNGCTAVPDSGPTFDFTEACNDHDRCYVNQPYGSDSAGRRACDRAFAQDMLDHCDDRWPDSADRRDRRVCRGVARVYYFGVRVFGGISWDEGEPAPLAA